jgi:Tol biopolymer transport system component
LERGDPGVIVFNLNAGDDLRAIRPDGTGLRPFKLGESCEPLDFSADGRIVACADRSIPRDIFGMYVMRRDGSDWRRIPLPRGSNHSPSFSPDGDEIVFLHSPDEYGSRFELWKAGIDGAGAERLVAGDIAEPTWSPDGTRIAFMRDPPDVVSEHQCWEGDMVVVDAAGGDERLVAEDGSAPEWSPDGERLAFMTECNAIAVVSVAGGPPTVLARDGWEPEWSPDGTRIAFVRETGPCGHATCLQRIFVVPATGGKPRAIGPHVFDPFGFFWLPSSTVTNEPA